MELANRPATLGKLKASGYQVLPVKAELRKNLIAKLREGEELFPGIVGYDDTVLPQLQNALLSGQDLILLGERGQAKSRILRSLVSLLDEWTPVLEGIEIPENPFDPISAPGKQLVEEQATQRRSAGCIAMTATGKARNARHHHRGPHRRSRSDQSRRGPISLDELTIHYGLLPRVNRGIFAVNELPDLAERSRSGLLNVLEERDIQIRGHRVRLPSTSSSSQPPTPRTTRTAAASSRRSRTATARRSAPTIREDLRT